MEMEDIEKNILVYGIFENTHDSKKRKNEESVVTKHTTKDTSRITKKIHEEKL